MPDAHLSDGIAVGTVFATAHHAVPKALGSDLGCGMSALRLELRGGADPSSLSSRALERTLRELAFAIPVGDATHAGAGVAVPAELLDPTLSTRALTRARAHLAPRHLGTLGGGNHFVELDRGDDGSFWLLVHSGSRGIGAAIAKHHAGALASAAAAESAKGSITKRDGFGAFDVRTPMGAAFLNDLAYALNFARANREALAFAAARAVESVLGASVDGASAIDVPHNFIARESWFGEPLLVHRKGAVAAPVGAMALIPGSMGTASYLARGLGNVDAFGSCSHGAGRVMSRRHARDEVTLRALEGSMRRVVWDRTRARDLVEEAPEAYRDIAKVMADQDDLVTPVLRLTPLAVLKG